MVRKRYTLACQAEKSMYDRYSNHAKVYGMSTAELVRGILAEHLDELEPIEVRQ